MPREQGTLGMLRVALKEFYTKILLVEDWTTVDAISLSNTANTVVYDPSSDSAQYEIMFNLVSSSSTASSTLCQVGVDTAETGSLTNHWWRNYVPWRYSSGWQGPYLIDGDDDVMGWASAADTVDLMLRVRKVQT